MYCGAGALSALGLDTMPSQKDPTFWLNERVPVRGYEMCTMHLRDLPAPYVRKEFFDMKVAFRVSNGGGKQAAERRLLVDRECIRDRGFVVPLNMTVSCLASSSDLLSSR